MSINGAARSLGAAATTARYCALISLCVLLGPVSIAAAQDCTVRAAVIRETLVYERPATEFNTANGWVYPPPVAVLGAKVKVVVCTDRTVRFGLISQTWKEIAYWSNGKWQHGWVVAQNVQVSAVDQPSTWAGSLAQSIFLVPSAHAELSIITEDPPPGAVPPPSSPKKSSAGGLPNGDDSALASFYAVLFVCMVLGMLGKVIFDALSDPKGLDWKARARAGVLPIMVSPIIFLGIMKAADATAAAALASFIAVACTAFQNGFFWHTIFDRTDSKARKS